MEYNYLQMIEAHECRLKNFKLNFRTVTIIHSVKTRSINTWHSYFEPQWALNDAVKYILPSETLSDISLSHTLKTETTRARFAEILQNRGDGESGRWKVDEEWTVANLPDFPRRDATESHIVRYCFITEYTLWHIVPRLLRFNIAA